MRLFAAVSLALSMLSLGCGGDNNVIADRGAAFPDPHLGVSAHLPAGWHVRRARFGDGMREDLIAASFPLPRPGRPETPSRDSSVCPAHLRLPPGGVGLSLIEYPKFNGPRVAQFKGWFVPRPRHFHLGRPTNQEGYDGFNIHFQDHGRALQALVCVHTGEFSDRRRRQTERFLDSLRFELARKISGPRAARETRRAIDLGGHPLDLVAGQGSLWALICERHCSAKVRPSVDRIVRIDPSRGKVIDSHRLRGASGLAVGAGGVFVTDFWRGTVRRLDPTTLRLTAKLKLVLPFDVVPGDNAFLPYDIAVGDRGVWVSTARGMATRIDSDAIRAVARVRLPSESTGEIAAGAGGVWVAEGLAGVYRIDPVANRVTAKIRESSRRRSLSVDQVVLGRGKVFALGPRTQHGAIARGNAVTVIAPNSNRVQKLTSLPSGPIAAAFGDRALWVGTPGTLERISAKTGAVTRRFRARVGWPLAIAGGRVWTAFPTGRVQEVAPR